MLVLSRNVDESIIIGHDIKVMVVDIRADRVRLGIEAPREIPVHRNEIYDVVFPGKPLAVVKSNTGGETAVQVVT